jgi:hypothetical protein
VDESEEKKLRLAGTETYFTGTRIAALDRSCAGEAELNRESQKAPYGRALSLS